MKLFSFFLFLVLSTTCMAVKSRPQGKLARQDPAQKYDERFLGELNNLSQEKLTKYDIRRKLHLLFNKYELNHSQRRNLLFGDGVDLDGLQSLLDILQQIL
jgi:hypothetical protein